VSADLFNTNMPEKKNGKKIKGKKNKIRPGSPPVGVAW